MDYRKLIKFGNNSYVISLPRDWIKRNKLNKGDIIYLDENDKSEICLSARNVNNKKILKKIVIDTNNKSMELVRTEIVSAYLTNYDVIEIRGQLLKKEAVSIKNYLRELTGMEIIDQDSVKIVAKYLIDIKEVPINTMIRRMDMIIRGMIDDTLLSFEENHYESIYNRDKDINRLVFLTDRIIRSALEDQNIAKLLNTNNVRLLRDWMIVLRMEKIGDQTKRIARHLARVKLSNRAKNELKRIYEEVKVTYLDVMKSYHTNDKCMAYLIDVSSREKIRNCVDFLDKLTKPNHVCYKLVDCRLLDNIIHSLVSCKYIARDIINGE